MSRRSPSTPRASERKVAFASHPVLLRDAGARDVPGVALPDEPLPAPRAEAPFEHRAEDARAHTASGAARADPHPDLGTSPLDRAAPQVEARAADEFVTDPRADDELLALEIEGGESAASRLRLVGRVLGHRPGHPGPQMFVRGEGRLAQGRTVARAVGANREVAFLERLGGEEGSLHGARSVLARLAGSWDVHRSDTHPERGLPSAPGPRTSVRQDWISHRSCLLGNARVELTEMPPSTRRVWPVM